MNSVEFIDWLTEELNKRGWTQSDLARKSGITKGGLSHVFAGTRKPGIDMCKGIAGAFDLPEIYVFSMAGLMQPIEYDEVSEEFRIILHELSAAGKRDLMQIAHMILRWESKID